MPAGELARRAPRLSVKKCVVNIIRRSCPRHPTDTNLVGYYLRVASGPPKQATVPVMNVELEELLGGEEPLFDPEVEKKGVQAMMEALTDEEKAALADPAMPMRHFRAEKVSSPWT